MPAFRGLLFYPREGVELVDADLAHMHTHRPGAFDAPLRAFRIRLEQLAFVADPGHVLGEPPAHGRRVAAHESAVLVSCLFDVADHALVRRAALALGQRLAVVVAHAVALVRRDVEVHSALLLRESGERAQEFGDELVVIVVAQRAADHAAERRHRRMMRGEHGPRLDLAVLAHAHEVDVHAVHAAQIRHLHGLLEIRLRRRLRECTEFLLVQHFKRKLAHMSCIRSRVSRLLPAHSPVSTSSRIAGMSARSALPRCEIAFFCSGVISAEVSSSPLSSAPAGCSSGMKIGS